MIDGAIVGDVGIVDVGILIDEGILSAREGIRQFRYRAASCGRRMTRSPEELVPGDRALRRGPGRGPNAIAKTRNGRDGLHPSANAAAPRARPRLRVDPPRSRPGTSARLARARRAGRSAGPQGPAAPPRPRRAWRAAARTRRATSRPGTRRESRRRRAPRDARPAPPRAGTPRPP